MTRSWTAHFLRGVAARLRWRVTSLRRPVSQVRFLRVLDERNTPGLPRDLVLERMGLALDLLVAQHRDAPVRAMIRRIAIIDGDACRLAAWGLCEMAFCPDFQDAVPMAMRLLWLSVANQGFVEDVYGNHQKAPRWYFELAFAAVDDFAARSEDSERWRAFAARAFGAHQMPAPSTGV